MKCPCCGKTVTRSHFSCQSGAKGGKATGKAKARTTEQAKKAAAARWEKQKNHGRKE